MNNSNHNNPQPFPRLAAIPIALMALQVLPVLLLWPLPERWSTILAPIISFYWIANYPLALLFSHPLSYLMLLLAAGSILLLALFAASRRRTRVLLVAGFAIVLLYALSPWYQYPLEASSGYRLQAVTAPHWWQRGLRFNQVLAERVPCRYQLAGWDAGARLYYTATCHGEESAWRYSPHNGRRERVQAIPSALAAAPGDRDTLIDHVRASGVRPARQEPSVRRLLLRDAGPVSPDGRYTALIANHLYSVQDVMVLDRGD